MTEFTNRKRQGMNTFVCAVSLNVAETPKASIKDHGPILPIIPFGIIAYGFVGQPFSKQLYNLVISHSYFAEDGKEIYQDSNARPQPLFCSLNLLFGCVLVAVAVVVCLKLPITTREYASDGLATLMRIVELQCPYGQILDTHFFTFSYKTGLP